MNVLRRIFWFLNRFFMVPAFRLGLGPLICSPIAGYIMVIKNIGRKSGKLYYTPTNYAIKDGKVYCMAGFGKHSHWYLNIQAHPFVEVILPGRTISGSVSDVTDHDKALNICKQIMINAGFAAIFEGYNPHKASREQLEQTLKRAAVIEITPTGIGSGPLDQGGWHWVTLIIIALIALFLILR